MAERVHEGGSRGGIWAAVTAWATGRGLLGLHAGSFALVACVLVMINLLRSPAELWFWQPLTRWGVVLAVHALLVATRAAVRMADQAGAAAGGPQPVRRRSRPALGRTLPAPRLTTRPVAAAFRALPGASARVGRGLDVVGRGGRERWRQTVESPRVRATARAVRDRLPSPGRVARADEAAAPAGWGWSAADAGEPVAADRASSGGRRWRVGDLGEKARQRAATTMGRVREALDPPALVEAADPVAMPPVAPEVQGWGQPAAGWEGSGWSPPAGGGQYPSWPAGQNEGATTPGWDGVDRSERNGDGQGGDAGRDIVIAGPSPAPGAVPASETDWRWLEAAAAAWLARREAETAGREPDTTPGPGQHPGH